MSALHDRADLYVLGLLDPAEAAETERLAAADPALAAAIDAARARFAPIDDTAEPVAPSAALWSRIEAELDTAQAAPAPRPAAQRPDPSRAARRWRGTALAALAACLLLAVTLGWRSLNPPAPQVIAVLLDSGQVPVAVIEDFGGTRQRLVPLVRPDAPADATFQVWTKWSDEVGPVSLGVLDDLRATTLSSQGLPPPRPGQLYEITIEGPGGSPTGLPTGPIVGLGLGAPPL